MSSGLALSGWIGALCLGAALAACSSGGEGTGVEKAPSIRAELEAIAQVRIFFGHQSVGSDILEGLKDLAAAENLPVQIVQVPAACGLSRGTVGHGLVGENGAPGSKVQSFVQAFEGSEGEPPDYALMKFCYVDFQPNSDVEAIFAEYRKAMDELKRRYPSTTFVHVTVPLTAGEGLKGRIKRLLGRETSAAYNEVRERFNERLRKTYAGEPIFDLAVVESTRPDGSRATERVGGRDIPMLYDAYTYDGGHLTPLGREHAARELVRLIASLEARRASGATGAAEASN